MVDAKRVFQDSLRLYFAPLLWVVRNFIVMRKGARHGYSCSESHSQPSSCLKTLDDDSDKVVTRDRSSERMPRSN
jgi:hypothetical protein